METVNIHEAKTHLSKLVEQVAAGTPVVIAKAGRPLVRMVALDAPPVPQRLGFLAGEVAVPDDFDTMGADEIAALFGTVAVCGGLYGSVLLDTPPGPSIVVTATAIFALLLPLMALSRGRGLT